MTAQRLDELIQKYVLGNLSESEADELSAALSQDEATDARRKWRLALKTDAYLEEAAAEMGHEPIENEPVTVGKLEAIDRRRLAHAIWALTAVAAAIAIAFLGPFRSSNAPPESDEPLGVATVLRIDGSGRANAQRVLTRGDAVLAGDQLTISEGIIELVFRDSGVHAVAAAPLSMTAASSERIFLHRGDVKLHVPPQGTGFVVETAEREITDLGTVFVVTARENASQVFVLDGQVSIEQRSGEPGRLLNEGEVASFDHSGKMSLLTKKAAGMPELSQSPSQPGSSSLTGVIFGLQQHDLPKTPLANDILGQQLTPLIKSGFQQRGFLDSLQSGHPLRFSGIAGGYKQFAMQQGLDAEVVNRAGWLAWYSGQVAPPRPGRYRFWGYADNSLLVAIDGKPVFEGSRYDSAFRESARVPRQDHPAWPCLNALAGFASGPWVELGDEPIQLDLLFGEKHGNLTFGLLLVEREGDAYEKTSWGQPKWPLLLTEAPRETELHELNQLQHYMEEKLMGSFTVAQDAVWKAN